MNIDKMTMQVSHEDSCKPPNVTVLLQYQDWRFVEAAYELLLARKPDKEGYSFYLSRIRGGVRKIQILKEISRSPEAASGRGDIKGLRKALLMDAIGSLPVIGTIFQRLLSLEGNSWWEVRLRILEQKNSVLGDVQTALVTQQTAAEARLSQVSQLLGDLNNQLTPLSQRIALLEALHARDIQNLVQSVEHLGHGQSAVSQSVEDLRQRQLAVGQSVEELLQRQSTFAQSVEDMGQRQSAFAQSVEDLLKRQSEVETHQLPTLLQTLSDINQRQLASDNDRDNLTRSVPVALRKLARDIAEGDKKMTKLELLLENRHQQATPELRNHVGDFG